MLLNETEEAPLIEDVETKDEVDEETEVSPARCDYKEEEKEEVDSSEEKTGVSLARWWVLAIFSLLGMVQCMLWNTWGPVRGP